MTNNHATPPSSAESRRTLQRGLLLAALAALLLTPLLIVTRSHYAAMEIARRAGVDTAQVWLKSLGKAAGILAAVLLMTQFALSARLKPLDEAFGLNKLLRLHRLLGAAAAVTATMHPLLLYATDYYRLAGFQWRQWPELLGALPLTLLWLLVCTAVWRSFLQLSYEAWRIIHWLAFPTVLLVFIHGFFAGSDLAEGWPLAFWLGIFAAYVTLFIYAKFVRPWQLRRRPYQVAAVKPLNHNVCRLQLQPTTADRLRAAPGQFALIRHQPAATTTTRSLSRLAALLQRHPFTIVAPPSDDGALTFAIKNCGDFTATIPNISVGDRVLVEGPYGRFSHCFHPAPSLLFIAGGIGVTPIMSMLRHLARTDDRRHLTLIWANRTQDDILFAPELDAFWEAAPQRRIFHVLSRQADWAGEQGHIDQAILDRLLDEHDRRATVFLCGPDPMMRSVRRHLRRLGFPARRIITESFSF